MKPLWGSHLGGLVGRLDHKAMHTWSGRRGFLVPVRMVSSSTGGPIMWPLRFLHVAAPHRPLHTALQRRIHASKSSFRIVPRYSSSSLALSHWWTTSSVALSPSPSPQLAAPLRSKSISQLESLPQAVRAHILIIQTSYELHTCRISQCMCQFQDRDAGGAIPGPQICPARSMVRHRHKTI